MSESLDCRVRADTISLAGELDLVTAPALRAQLMSAVATTSATVLMLDMSQVRFLDAQCAGIIAAAAETARCHGTRLRVDGLHGTPKTVLDLLGLTSLLGGGSPPDGGSSTDGGSPQGGGSSLNGGSPQGGGSSLNGGSPLDGGSSTDGKRNPGD